MTVTVLQRKASTQQI